MKKMLLLFCIFAITNQVFANFISQGNWRWHKDDGDEASATYLADLNTIPALANDDNIRLRVEFYNPQSGILPLDNTTLAYSTTAQDGSWTIITDTALMNDFILVKSPYLTSFAPTTQQLDARSGYTFKAGKVIDSYDGYTDSLPPGYSTEYVWVIKPTEHAKLNTTYYFETSILGYDQPLPAISIGAVLPVTLTGFSVTPSGKEATIRWTTLSETNNDRFDILRSADNQTWQTVTTVPAKGKPGATTRYEATDKTPLNGNSYYRLRQYDKDGKTTLSNIQSLSMAAVKAFAASVYPNPTANSINIQVKNYDGAVTTSLMNAQGTVLHRQVLTVSAATSTYRLALNQQLASGIYYVQLKGSNLSQTIKVVVQ